MQDKDTVKICSLASGSNGNAYYIEYKDNAVLVDVGISYKQLSIRSKIKKIDLRKVRAAFITHEHSDHVRGLRALCEKVGTKAYLTKVTAEHCRPFYLPDNVIGFSAGDTINIGDIAVHSFAKSHDASDPCSFRVEAGEISIGVMTDIGTPNEELCKQLSLCNAVFLESNYDEQMLWEGKYPAYLKQRVASDVGHLSNDQSVALITNTDPQHLHTIILSHISADNNRPGIALKTFGQLREKYNIITASRYEAGDIISISQSEWKVEKEA